MVIFKFFCESESVLFIHKIFSTKCVFLQKIQRFGLIGNNNLEDIFWFWFLIKSTFIFTVKNTFYRKNFVYK